MSISSTGCALAQSRRRSSNSHASGSDRLFFLAYNVYVCVHIMNYYEDVLAYVCKYMYVWSCRCVCTLCVLVPIMFTYGMCVCVFIVGVMFTQCDQRVVQLCTHNVYVLVLYSLPYTISGTLLQ